MEQGLPDASCRAADESPTDAVDPYMSPRARNLELRLVLEFCDVGSLRDVLDQV